MVSTEHSCCLIPVTANYCIAKTRKRICAIPVTLAAAVALPADDSAFRFTGFIGGRLASGLVGLVLHRPLFGYAAVSDGDTGRGIHKRS